MACNCAARMRKYVLPNLGYTFNEATQTWSNPEFGLADLRNIPDSEIEKHHLRLTVEITARYTLDQFREWWLKAFDKPEAAFETAKIEYINTRAITDERDKMAELPLEQQWAWFVKRWLLPELRTKLPKDTTLETADRLTIIHKFLKTGNQAYVMDWWNLRATPALHLTNVDYEYYMNLR